MRRIGNRWGGSSVTLGLEGGGKLRGGWGERKFEKGDGISFNI